MKRALLATAALIAAFVPATAASATAKPSHQVTPSGQYLYEFEALLHQTFGSYDIVICGAIRPATACHYGWFYNAAKVHVPNELLLGYAFTFTNLGPSNLHLMPAWFSVKSTSWGNRTAPVTINGRLISCNSANTEFLVGNAQAFGAGPSSIYTPGLPGGGIMVNGGGWYCTSP